MNSLFDLSGKTALVVGGHGGIGKAIALGLADAGAALPSGMGKFAVSDADLAKYNMLFFHALVIQGFFAGIVTGKIGEGKAVAGFKHSVFFIIVAVIAYTLLM